MLPKPGSKRWIKIINVGCGATRDYWGDFDCPHTYEWECGDCPVVVSRSEQAGVAKASNPPQDVWSCSPADIQSWSAEDVNQLNDVLREFVVATNRNKGHQ